MVAASSASPARIAASLDRDSLRPLAAEFERHATPNDCFGVSFSISTRGFRIQPFTGDREAGQVYRASRTCGSDGRIGGHRAVHRRLQRERPRGGRLRRSAVGCRLLSAAKAGVGGASGDPSRQRFVPTHRHRRSSATVDDRTMTPGARRTSLARGRAACRGGAI